MNFLSIKDIDYSYYGQTQILHSISWEIPKGEFHCLVGGSGSGKTTLLKIASGLLQPTKGSIFMDDEEVKYPKPNVGFVFQSPTLLEWKSVLHNILLPISLKSKPTKEDIERADSLLELMGLLQFRNHLPTELSGGQQSRVAIARALIKKPSMLFLDEPFAALDAITREELQDDLLKLCQLNQSTVLFITHDISEAVYLGDKVALMNTGKIIADFQVPLQKPRSMDIRYDKSFNEICFKIRNVMAGGTI